VLALVVEVDVSLEVWRPAISNLVSVNDVSSEGLDCRLYEVFMRLVVVVDSKTPSAVFAFVVHCKMHNASSAIAPRSRGMAQ